MGLGLLLSGILRGLPSSGGLCGGHLLFACRKSLVSLSKNISDPWHPDIFKKDPVKWYSMHGDDRLH